MQLAAAGMQFGDPGGSGPGAQADRQPRQDAGGEQPGQVAGEREYQGAGTGQRECGQQRGPAPDLVGDPAQQEQRGDGAHHIGREHQGQHDL